MNNALTQKQQFWKTHLDAAARSGLSIADYAKANQLRPQTLYQWRSTLKGRSVTASTQTQFTQVVSSTTVSGSPLTIVLGDATLRFDRLPDPDWLSALLSGVRS